MGQALAGRIADLQFDAEQAPALSDLDIHPVAQRIAELTGGEAFDGFKSSAPFDKIAVAVIDCGGTARVGVYPMKKVPTVDIHATSPAGPLAMFITEDLFVSGVKPEDITEV